MAGPGLPTTAGAFQPVVRKGNNPNPADNNDAFVAKLVQDADAEPDVVELAQPVFAVYEDEGVAYIRVSRTGSGFGAVYLRVLCSDGTATAGEDYDDIDAGYTLSWPNGKTGIRRHTILVTDDGVGEGTETVNCTLEAPSGYGLSVLGARPRRPCAFANARPRRRGCPATPTRPPVSMTTRATSGARWRDRAAVAPGSRR